MTISIIDYCRYDETKRMDAMYHHRDRILYESILSNFPNKSTIGDEFENIKSTFNPQTHGNKVENLSVIDLEDITLGFVNHIQQMKSYQLGSNRKRIKPGDLIISRLRSYLKEIAIVPNIKSNNILCSTEFIIFREKNDSDLNVQFLYTYLHSKYIQTILQCSQEGTNHPRFSVDLLLKLPIPIPPPLLLEEVTNLIDESLDYRKKIDEITHNIKEKLRNNLQLQEEPYSSKKTNIVTRNEYLQDKRLDAEYFSLNYIKSEENLATNPNSKLFSDVAIKGENRVNPTKNPNENIHYIDISNVDPKFGDYSETLIKGYQAPSRARKKPLKKDILVSTVRPNRNAVCIIDELNSNTVCSTGFSVIRCEEINPYFLFAQLKSKQIYNQLIRRSSAAMYPAVSEDQIFSIRIIDASKDFQYCIEKQIKEIILLFRKIKENKMEAINKLENFIDNVSS